MKSFSERYGYKPVREVLQIESMDDELRTALFNIFYHLQEGINQDNFMLYTWRNHFNKKISNHPNYNDFIEEFFNNAKWNEVYDFIEFTLSFSFSNKITSVLLIKSITIV